MSNFVRDFRRFQHKRRSLNEVKKGKLQESVTIRDSKYIVSGVVVEQSFINSYVKKVKDQTGKNLRQTYSDQDIAEELIKYLVEAHGNVETIPVSALLGGEEEMEEEVDDVSMEEPDAEVDEEGIEEEPTEDEEASAEELVGDEDAEEGADIPFEAEGEDFESAEDIDFSEDAEEGAEEDAEEDAEEEGAEEGAEEGEEGAEDIFDFDEEEGEEGEEGEIKPPEDEDLPL